GVWSRRSRRRRAGGLVARTRRRGGRAYPAAAGEPGGQGTPSEAAAEPGHRYGGGPCRRFRPRFTLNSSPSPPPMAMSSPVSSNQAAVPGGGGGPAKCIVVSTFPWRAATTPSRARVALGSERRAASAHGSKGAVAVRGQVAASAKVNAPLAVRR